MCDALLKVINYVGVKNMPKPTLNEVNAAEKFYNEQATISLKFQLNNETTVEKIEEMLEKTKIVHKLPQVFEPLKADIMSTTTFGQRIWNSLFSR